MSEELQRFWHRIRRIWGQNRIRLSAEEAQRFVSEPLGDSKSG